MGKAITLPAAALARLLATGYAISLLLAAPGAYALGVPAGTVVENTATVSYSLAGNQVTLDTNTATLTVAERIEVVVTRQSPRLDVRSGDTARAILFRVTSTGNGRETFDLTVDNNLAGSDFNPLPSVPAIYFDSDGSGDLSAGDVPYQPGVNEPELAADSSVDILVVNDIPAQAGNGELGLTELTATSQTGSGTPGTGFPGLGDGGSEAVLGVSGGSAAAIGEYVVNDVQLSFGKAQQVSDPDGGQEPVAGATVTYTITVAVQGPGTAAAAFVRDPVPQYTTYLAGSLSLNGSPLSDDADADAGEFESAAPAAVVVRLGDLAQADGPQVIQFSVTID
ncbi:MAG: hypothetical protein AAFX56_02040 [Pseudomonadota bacterium]